MEEDPSFVVAIATFDDVNTGDVADSVDCGVAAVGGLKAIGG